MIIKSYDIKKNKLNLLKNNFFLLYGENLGLKKDIKNFINSLLKENENDLETSSFYESDIINNDENFYNAAYSGSLFGSKKIIYVYESTDKILKKISNVFEKNPENIFFIFISQVLEKKSKLRDFFEKHKSAICIAFSGVILILRPGFEVWSIGQVSQVLATIFFAGSYLMVKDLTRTESSTAIVGMMTLLVTIALAPMAAYVWVTPSLNELISLFSFRFFI